MRSHSKPRAPSRSRQSKAWLTLEKNLEAVSHLVDFSTHEVKSLHAKAARLHARAVNADPRKQASLKRSAKRFVSAAQLHTDRLTTARLWQLVTLVTCVEAYLQDILSLAASVDTDLMGKSDQRASYAEVLSANSLDDLAGELRGRWARNWLSDGGPTRWIERLQRMGARGYGNDLAARLELMWGLRHVIVHAAGLATAEFVRRHPGVVARAGDRVGLSSVRIAFFLGAVQDFLEPTEAFFLRRYPSLCEPRP